MTDIVDRTTRSKMMAGIRGRHTRPELLVRQALHAAGFRFRLHDARLPGKPDIVLSRWHVVIEINGCFWHRHEGCRFATTPSTRPEFWESKFARNVERDRLNHTALLGAGWRLALVWECALKAGGSEAVINRLKAWIVSNEAYLEIP